MNHPSDRHIIREVDNIALFSQHFAAHLCFVNERNRRALRRFYWTLYLTRCHAKRVTWSKEFDLYCKNLNQPTLITK